MFSQVTSHILKAATLISICGALNFAATPVSASAAAAATTPVTASAPVVAPAVTDTAKATEKTMVMITSGSRYHVKGCRYLKNKGKQISIGDAMKQGFAPCNVCHAPKIGPKA